ncbi:MAG TPA: TIGR00266 family protein [Mycobacteriales bacterium]|nr:TIGR00266 family protein [Mycobacteriales bacterium]
MQVQVRHQPSFAVARCLLAPGEPVRVESGAMLATSWGVQLEASMQGGMFGGLKRAALGGESLFVTTYTAPQGGGWVDVAANLPGDVVTVSVTPERPFFITRGCWIANSHGVEIQTRWGGAQNLFGGEGGFVIQATGQGDVVLGAYGAVDTLDLAPGEAVTVDSGHVVAYDAGVQTRLRRAVEGRSIQSLTSGEGFVFDFAGPGRVMIQARNPRALVEWLTNELPFSRN